MRRSASIWLERYFYPRSPCGERQNVANCRHVRGGQISIHALLAESDAKADRIRALFGYFYPRSPCGERRSGRPETRLLCAISIHALLAESDLSAAAMRAKCVRISIHALLAESDATARRRVQGHHTISIHALLAESDLRVLDGSKSSIEISIHALLAESDAETTHQATDGLAFLSTLSLRRATCVCWAALNRQ